MLQFSWQNINVGSADYIENFLEERASIDC